MAGQRKLRIAIATTGRFHVLDLARELDALGHDVRFYSYVPRRRALQFGLPERCQVSLLAFVAPLVALGRLAPRFAPRLRERITNDIMDFIVSWMLSRCDVFICMSGIYLRAIHRAKSRYGARVYVERGSQHILSQQDILRTFGGPGISKRTIDREIAAYNLADKIVVPSIHAEDSFKAHGIDRSKLFRNPYGVDISNFSVGAPREPASREDEILFVGRWSMQKGADLLVDCVLALPEARLVHAGDIVDVAFPTNPRFAHLGHIDQLSLRDLYRRAAVLALPSRQDGFGLVLVQALACGLPVVCSDRTGGPDIRDLIARPEAVSIVPHDDPQALKAAIVQALRNAPQLTGEDLLGDQGRAQLTWRAYGVRYEAELTAHVEIEEPKLSRDSGRRAAASPSARRQRRSQAPASRA